MRGILGIIRQTNAIASRAGTSIQAQTIRSNPFPLITGKSWLSSKASAGSGGDNKKGSTERSDRSVNKSSDNSRSRLKTAGPKGQSAFKKMADAVKDKTTGGSRRAGGGDDKVSSDRVRHERSSGRFTLDLGNNQQARIDYRMIGPDKIEMYHSEVPAELRGRGLGKLLAKGSLELAARENMKVKVTCTYLIDFVNKSTDPKLKKSLL